MEKVSPQVQSRRKAQFLLGLSCAIVLLGALFVWLKNQPSADATFNRYLVALQRQDWGAIYDLASEKERGRQSWNREQFVTVMQEIASHTLVEMDEVEFVAYPNDHGKSYDLTFNAKAVDGTWVPAKILVPVKRGPEDFHPVIYPLALHLHTFRKAPNRDSLKMLISACDKAQIREFARLDDNMVFSIDRLKEWMDGKIEWNSIYTHERSGTIPAAHSPVSQSR